MPQRTARPRALKLLEEQGLGPAARRQVRNLSKGMGQKVQLIAALIHEPDLVLLDEPFSGLDPVNQQAIEAMVRALAARGATVVFSTHVMQHAERLCDQVVLIARGRKAFDGTVDAARAAAPRTLVLEGDIAPDAVRALPGVADVSVEDAGRRATAHLGRPGGGLQRPGAPAGRLRPGAGRRPLRAEGAQPARRLPGAGRRGGRPMIRLLKIARREYLAYVRTVGFWLSIAMLPLMVAVLGGAPMLMLMTAPPQRLAVVDLTGAGYAADIGRALAVPGPSAPGAPPRRLAVIVPAAIGPVRDAAEAGRLVRPLLLGAGRGHPAQLDGAAVIHDEAGAVQVDFWSRNLPDPILHGVVRQAVAERMRARRLEAEGVAPAAVEALKSVAPSIADYSARAAARTGLKDRIPGIVGLAFGMLLWMAAISGAGILLSSVVEEKSSRVLEVLLASAAPSEIMLGKILGVACVTVTVLGPGSAWARWLCTAPRRGSRATWPPSCSTRDWSSIC